MTVRELIERLKAFEPDLMVWVMGGADCDMPIEPEPAVEADPNYPYRGVYL